ncbi:LacI family DNA-binding transcriptional regulator [Bifidobacterium crudilactis]|uniref:LacI family DNA-binding transcriptional regulator n=1 Tax=Bifidobacterium crudilactis TaxID=327277 RepID=UPI00264844FE|nr:LacI family DNA-binding transcriptional regulator [Bifidobacterium crudilactis]MDN6209181.1 LacI family DNA-binding transcriptional regulator [Bifidobacterium crudilactis]
MSSKSERGSIGEKKTIAQVAALAHVSVSTVSLAFREHGPISDRMRSHVLQVADDIGYTGPDPIAHSLKSGSMGIVGVAIAEQVVHAFDNPITTETMNGLSAVLDDNGYSILLLQGGASVDQRTIKRLSAVPLDALIFMSRGEPFVDLLRLARTHHIPMVGVEGPYADDVSVVEISDREGMGELADHVQGMGHRHVGVLMRTTRLGYSGPPGPLLPIAAGLRAIGNVTIRGRLEAVAERVPDAVRVEAAARDVNAGEMAARALLSSDPRVTVVMAQNDLLAVGALRAAEALGLRVPEDLSVTGFDGLRLSWMTRSLTTMRQPLEERGRSAGKLASQLISNPQNIQRVKFDTVFVPGDTLAAPRLA